MSSNPHVWYRDKASLRIGDVYRYTVTYTPTDPNIKHIFYRLKNTENSPIRAVHLLNGPFVLYCHVVPYNYDYNKKFTPESEINQEVVYAQQIKPGQTFNVRLYLNDNSRVKDDSNEIKTYQWEIDIVSQIVITKSTTVGYDFMIGDNMAELKKVNRTLAKTITTLSNFSDQKYDYEYDVSINPNLNISKKVTEDLWSSGPKYPDKPAHLVIITHGIFSNVTADMLYLKDTLESRSDENLLIRGHAGNAAKTDKGVKRLGMGVGSYVISLIDADVDHKIDKISFVGHSLGGNVQLYALKYILLIKGSDYFSKRNIQPVNLVCMASPILGVLNDMSFLISWFLDFGTLGRTGRDLTLLRKIPSISDLKIEDEKAKRDMLKPILETIPDEPLQSFMASFMNLTVYANAVNDGIVPLRTAALLYLDWKALGDVTDLKKHKPISTTDDDIKPLTSAETVGTSAGSVGEIPDDKDESAEDEDTDDTTTATKSEGRSNKKNKTLGDRYKSLIHLNRSNSDDDGTIKLTNRQKRFLKINAKGSDLSEVKGDNDVGEDQSDDADDVADAEQEEISGFMIPPKANIIESAINALISPEPTDEYVIDPSSRSPVIFHDKYYNFKDLPDIVIDEKKSYFFKKVFNYTEWKRIKQVKIAKKYHTKDLVWRKVLVNLPPDAHNNIVVRRRFANGYGWGVVDHLCDSLFNGTTGSNGKYIGLTPDLSPPSDAFEDKKHEKAKI